MVLLTDMMIKGMLLNSTCLAIRKDAHIEMMNQGVHACSCWELCDRAWRLSTYIGMFVHTKKLNQTSAIDSPFQTFRGRTSRH